MVVLALDRWKKKASRTTPSAPANDFSPSAFFPPFARPRDRAPPAAGKSVPATYAPTDPSRFAAAVTAVNPTTARSGVRARRASAPPASDQALRDLHRALVGDVSGAGVTGGPLAGMGRGAGGKKESTDAYTLVPQLIYEQGKQLLHPPKQQARRAGREPPPSALPAAFRQPRRNSHSVLPARRAASSSRTSLASSSRAASFTGSSPQGSSAVRSRAAWEDRVQAYASSASVNTATMTGVGLKSTAGSDARSTASLPIRSYSAAGSYGSPSQSSRAPLPQFHQASHTEYAYTDQVTQPASQGAPPLIQLASTHAGSISSASSKQLSLRPRPSGVEMPASMLASGNKLTVPRSHPAPAGASGPVATRPSGQASRVPSSSVSRTFPLWMGRRKHSASEPARSTAPAPATDWPDVQPAGASTLASAERPPASPAAARNGSAAPAARPRAWAIHAPTAQQQPSAACQSASPLSRQVGGAGVAQHVPTPAYDGMGERQTNPRSRPITMLAKQWRGVLSAEPRVKASGQPVPPAPVHAPPSGQTVAGTTNDPANGSVPETYGGRPVPVQGPQASTAGPSTRPGGERVPNRPPSSATRHYGADLARLHHAQGPAGALTAASLAQLAGASPR